MPLSKDQLLLFGAAALLRCSFFLAFPSLSDLLASRVEVSTPVSSFTRLQEGLFLYSRNVSPYDGGIFHQAPLLLPLFSLLPDREAFPFATDMVYVVGDLLAAVALVRIANSRASVSSRLFTSSRKDQRWTSTAVAGAFLFNPFSVITCLARSTSVFTNCAVLHAISEAVSGSPVNSLLALSIASYLSLYPVLLSPPMAILAYNGLSLRATQRFQPLKFGLAYSAGLVANLGSLGLASWLVMGSSWEFLAATYGVQLTLSDLTPNVGLWWYFFIEMFDSFREFFLSVFWLHMSSYVFGLTIRLRKQPLFVATTLLGIFAIYKPYPSIADASVYLALVPLFHHLFPLLRYGFIATAAILYATFLGPTFYHLWIYAGSGNANFFYAITLVWSLGLTLLVADFILAALRDEIELERPELKGMDVSQL